MANYSLSEIDALARKATRGAGYSWGVAEDVGKSVRWLSAYGFSGSDILAKHLEMISGKHQDYLPKLKSTTPEATTEKALEFKNNDQPLCSLYCGTLINDLGHHLKDNKTLTFCNMLFPLLALPAAARTAEAYHIAIAYTCGETSFFCDANGITIKNSFAEPSRSTSHNGIYAELDAFVLDNSPEVICSRIQNNFKNTFLPNPQSRSITNEGLSILEKLAHKTYAPDTEESRLRGAG